MCEKSYINMDLVSHPPQVCEQLNTTFDSAWFCQYQETNQVNPVGKIDSGYRTFIIVVVWAIRYFE